MDKKLIYIADDDDNIREAIKIFLENDGYQVDDFSCGDDLLKKFTKSPCDLIILDIMMPGLDGFAICKKLREMSTVPIVFLTALDSDFDYTKGLSLGSDDYFTKPFSPMALVMRVKAIFRRIEFEKQNLNHHENALGFEDVSVDQKGKRVWIGEKEIELTPNEYEVLRFMIRHQDRAVSRNELLEEIWGYETVVETRATDDTVRRLRKKLKNSHLGIDAVWGYGFRLKARITE